MAITSYPFETQDVTETQFSEMFKELQDSGVVGDIDGTDLKVSSDGSGLDVQVGAGFAFVRGHVIKSDAMETRTLAAAEASPRIDRIVLRLDPVANAITVEVLKGTAAASPVAPALTQTITGVYEVSLARVAVAANVLNVDNANITDERPMAGGRVGVWTTSRRPANPRKGRFGFNTTTSAWEFWNGSAWGPLFDSAAYVPAGAARAQQVVAFESTTATTPSDLATIGPTHEVTVGASGRLMVVSQAWVRNTTLGAQTYFGVALTGANVIPAVVDRAACWAMDSADYMTLTTTFVFNGLTPGLTTVTQKYWVASGSGTYGRRVINSIPV